MSLRSSSRRLRSLVVPEPCLFCSARQSPAPIPYLDTRRRSLPNLHLRSYQTRRTYAVQARGSANAARDEYDTRNRKAFYNLTASDGLLSIKWQKAEAVYNDFVHKTKTDPSDTVTQLADRHGIKVSDVKDIGVVTCRIPEPKDSHGRTYPSSHPQTGAKMLLGCSKALDPSATLHIMAAIYLRDSLPAAARLASLFGPIDVAACRKMLSKLCDRGNPEAMTLEGLFLEQEGHVSRAKALYEAALSKANPMTFDARENTMVFPTPPPWIPLGKMLQETHTSESLTRAKDVYAIGALKGDDPLAFYNLALLQDDKNADWLKNMTKAASSGHLEAIYALAKFYVNSSSNGEIKPSVLGISNMNNALDWLKRRRSRGPTHYAQEWFRIAALRGHKPSMLELAELYELHGDTEAKAKTLSAIVELPPPGKPEQWPGVVADAKMRLSRLRAQARAG
ncbi:hypothetical protein EJ04DRAFT_579689 [Polyplosphaeria fusca]|uniref:Uncharacterized protein n=1 Tax=Polyplosphaeria fusca TaxID=682080 RepID=A0A9P4UW45_9PLEO|nr:hypothetical protein EJ04DRAFT_579689 [Polyplosphaeria fusca]